VQGKINRGRHTDHLAGRHSIRTNQTNHLLVDISHEVTTLRKMFTQMLYYQ